MKIATFLSSQTGISFFCHPMRKRLIVMAAVFVAMLASPLNGAVISFENPSDLNDFQQTANNFWSRSEGTGINGSYGLVGLNTGNNGWATYSAHSFNPQNANLSTGIFFKLNNPTTTSSGYSIMVGIVPNENYVPNLSNEENPDKNHILAALHYNSTSNEGEAHKFRLGSLTSVDGQVTPVYSDYHSLAFDSWYYLSLDISFDPNTSRYSYTISLFGTDEQGNPTGSALIQLTRNDVSVPGLGSAANNYLFFGLNGRAPTRGIDAVDNFTYNFAIPEARSMTLLGITGLGLLCLQRQRSLRP